MLELQQIESFYPESLRRFKRNILREYLQYKILAAIFGGKFAAKLVFMGGTAIHIVDGIGRFSEDLDFDNIDISKKDFKEIARLAARQLSMEGFNVETSVSFKRTFSADIKILELLYRTGLSRHKEEKILIKIDAEPQNFDYTPRRVILNKFDVMVGINVAPVDILLSQKFYAILKRKRAMGRDFYDAMFLAGKTKPNMAYLKSKEGIGDVEGLKKALLGRCAKLNFKRLALDTAPLVFVQTDANKIKLFPEFVSKMQ